MHEYMQLWLASLLDVHDSNMLRVSSKFPSFLTVDCTHSTVTDTAHPFLYFYNTSHLLCFTVVKAKGLKAVMYVCMTQVGYWKDLLEMLVRMCGRPENSMPKKLQTKSRKRGREASPVCRHFEYKISSSFLALAMYSP